MVSIEILKKYCNFFQTLAGGKHSMSFPDPKYVMDENVNCLFPKSSNKNFVNTELQTKPSSFYLKNIESIGIKQTFAFKMFWYASVFYLVLHKGKVNNRCSNC